MKPIIEKKALSPPQLGLAVASFAAFLGILTMRRLSELAIMAVNDFSVGIPFILVCLFIPFAEEWPQYYQILIKSITLIFVLLGSFFCLTGLHKCFALVSGKAALNFAVFGTIIFLLIFAAGIYELVFRELKAKNNSEKT